MAEVYMLSGKIASGKTTYAKRLAKEKRAVILSVDEITLALFDEHIGDKHDEYVERCENYLFEKSVEIIETGINVVLDWGFWTRREREYAKDFYGKRGIGAEFYFIETDGKTWRKRVEKRNGEILRGEVRAYYVDENLAKKFEAIYEPPETDEAGIRVRE